jgi:hypothetical protein
MPTVSRMQAPTRKATKRAYRRRVGWRHVWTDDGDMPEVAPADRSGRPCITLAAGKPRASNGPGAMCKLSPQDATDSGLARHKEALYALYYRRHMANSTSHSLASKPVKLSSFATVCRSAR